MVSAQHPRLSVRSCRLSAPEGRRWSERGFTAVELVVVMMIVAILLALVAPRLRTTREQASKPTIAIGAGVVWAGIQRYRADNRGLFPVHPTHDVLVSPAGVRYIKRWPSNGAGEPLEIELDYSFGYFPTLFYDNIGPTGEGKLVYKRGPNGISGRLIAYSSDGRLVFVRSVDPWNEDPYVRPVG